MRSRLWVMRLRRGTRRTCRTRESSKGFNFQGVKETRDCIPWIPQAWRNHARSSHFIAWILMHNGQSISSTKCKMLHVSVHETDNGSEKSHVLGSNAPCSSEDRLLKKMFIPRSAYRTALILFLKLYRNSYWFASKRNRPYVETRLRWIRDNLPEMGKLMVSQPQTKILCLFALIIPHTMTSWAGTQRNETLENSTERDGATSSFSTDTCWPLLRAHDDWNVFSHD